MRSSNPAWMSPPPASWPPWTSPIARGDLETSSQDLAHLLERPATPLAEVVRAGYNLLKVRSESGRRRLRHL